MLIAVAFVIFIVLPMIITPAFVPVFLPAVMMFFLITWGILAFVPVIVHKKDPLAAGVVFVTVLAPMFGVTRRDAQIDWRAIRRYPNNDYRLTVEHSWLREAADVKSAIETGLADGDRNTNVSSECRSSERGSGNDRQYEKTFHDDLFFL